jgi:hypothetical protein
MSQPRFVERVLGVSDRTRRLTVAVICGGLAAVAFGGSLVYEWGHSSVRSTDSLTTTYSDVTSLGTLATGYVLGFPVLLGAVGLAMAWPHLANRLRAAATGFGLGLAAILVAVAVQISRSWVGPVSSDVPSELRPQTITEYTKGLYFAFGALALAVVAVWLAGPNPWRRRAPSTMDSQPYVASTWDGRTQPAPGVMGGLSVSPADVIDAQSAPGEPLR